MNGKRPAEPGSDRAGKKGKKEVMAKFSDAVTGETLKKQVAEAWSRRTPFRHEAIVMEMDPFLHCVIPNFIQSQNFLEGLQKELLNLDFHEKYNDLYKFQQSDDLKKRREPHICALRKILFEHFRSWISDISKIDLESTIDMSCAKYEFSAVIGQEISVIDLLVPTSLGSPCCLCHVTPFFKKIIFLAFSDQRSNLVPLHWEYGVLTAGPPGKFPICPFFEEWEKSNTWSFVFFKKFQDNSDIHLDFSKPLRVPWTARRSSHCAPSLLFGLRQHCPGVYRLCGRANGDLQEGLCQGGPSQTAVASAFILVVSPWQPTSPQETLQHYSGHREVGCQEGHYVGLLSFTHHPYHTLLSSKTRFSKLILLFLCSRSGAGLWELQHQSFHLLQHHISKASILRRSTFFMVEVSHPYITTGKTIALTRRTFVVK
ncbi:hypothetical protein FD754_013022 [Muntiacus muntjak]|uniref:Uncharacterized protein n=1 Tax=Muntiacus muntjak TaxID=9888 RepID=A0A5N3VIN2_MUNMU|nr:hypothetical protein FD754_013022 [Muntiacus muntjak]